MPLMAKFVWLLQETCQHRPPCSCETRRKDGLRQRPCKVIRAELARGDQTIIHQEFRPLG